MAQQRRLQSFTRQREGCDFILHSDFVVVSREWIGNTTDKSLLVDGNGLTAWLFGSESFFWRSGFPVDVYGKDEVVVGKGKVFFIGDGSDF